MDIVIRPLVIVIVELVPSDDAVLVLTREGPVAEGSLVYLDVAFALVHRVHVRRAVGVYVDLYSL